MSLLVIFNVDIENSRYMKFKELQNFLHSNAEATTTSTTNHKGANVVLVGILIYKAILQSYLTL